MARYTIEQGSLEAPGEAVEIVQMQDSTGGIRAAVAPARGTELTSLAFMFEGQWREALYRAKDYAPVEGWQGRAPLLWPAVGRNYTPEQLAEVKASGEDPPMCSYRVGDRVYRLPRHGFAKDRKWELVEATAEQDGAQVVCRLVSDDKSRRMYPFDFEVIARYSLFERGVLLEYRVSSGTDGMIFVVGNHLTVKLGLTGGTVLEDCLFRCPATRLLTLTPESLLDGESEALDLSEAVTLDDPRWHNTVLSGFPAGEYWAEVIDPQSVALRVSQELDPSDLVPPEWMLFVLYGNPEDSYFCPEPWVGGPNALNTREGVVALERGQAATWRMRVEVVGGR